MPKVRLTAGLRRHAGGQAVVSAPGATVGEVLDDLAGRYPELAAEILNDDGSLHRFVNVFVNDDDARYLGGRDAALGAEDEVSIMPAVAGGTR